MNLYIIIEVYKMKHSYKVFICVWIVIILFFVTYYGYNLISDNN